MARYDKYDGRVGGFRAALAADWTSGEAGVPYGVGLDGSGRVVKGAGTTGVRGVLVIDQNKLAGEVVDVMTAGEIVDLPAPSYPAATTFYVNDGTGALETAAPAAGANKTQVGSTVEAKRLVVRVQRVQG